MRRPGYTRRQFVAYGLSLLVAGVFIGGAWFLDVRARDASGTYHVTVVRPDGRERAFDIGQLKALGMRKVMIDGKTEEGPTLLSVLEASAVTEFDSVTVLGQGVRDDGRITLKRDEVDRDVVLDFALRGTVKLVGPKIAWDDRVRDVMRVEVR